MQRRRKMIRRRGRHITPSQVEKVAEKAGRAAPAVALAGVLVGVPHGHHDAAALAGKPDAVAAVIVREAANAQQAAKGRHAAPATGAAEDRSYDVRSGDTLSGIARRYYHNAGDWQWLYHVNDMRVSDPDLIYPGETLRLPSDPPANYPLHGYVPRHATQMAAGSDSNRDYSSAATSARARSGSSSASGRAADVGLSRSTSLSGTLSCGALELLWRKAGGSSSEAVTAAAIAMAESGGSQYATNGSSGTRGYWQISPSWGQMSTYSAIGNAQAAVKISANGSNWNPWTTYTSGAYSGRC
jgi:LysM repeat protein